MSSMVETTTTTTAAAQGATNSETPKLELTNPAMVTMDEFSTTVVSALSATRSGETAPEQRVRRQKVVSLLTQLLRTLQEPDDLWVDSLISGAVTGAIRLFWEWKAFDHIPPEGIAYSVLAERVGTQEVLLSECLSS